MLLVPAISILATLNLAARQFRDFEATHAGVFLSVVTGVALLFIGLPFRRWCRRKGKNLLRHWLTQWLLVFLPGAMLYAMVPIWHTLHVAMELLGVVIVTAVASWFLADCRPFKPRT
jgi:hypothetical protein